jgi:very-short-patch-repair endonuclease
MEGEQKGVVKKEWGNTMGRLYNKKSLNTKRRELRNNKTDAEKYLWYELKNRQLCNKKFRRQHSVGNFILDFYCPEEKLAIELDGEHHYEDEQKKYDEERTKYLRQLGIDVLRFKNTDVIYGRDTVVKKIENYINGKK